MNKTVKELAIELNVSKQTIHRTIQKRNIETIQDGNKILLDDTAQTAIKEDLQDKTTQGGHSADDTRTIQNETADVPKRSTDETADDLRTEYIESLKAHIATLTEQLTVKDNQINLLTAEIEQERKERQTILIELMSLRQQPRIEAAAAAPKHSPSEPRPQKPAPQQQPPKRGFFQRLFGKH